MSPTADVSLLPNAHKLEGRIKQIIPVIRRYTLCVKCWGEMITSSSTGRVQYLFTLCFQAAAGIKVIGVKLRAYGSLPGVDSVNLLSYRMWGVWAAAAGEEYQLLWAQTVAVFQSHASACCLKKSEKYFFLSDEQLQELFCLFAHFLFR